jgi:thiol reductant ABC exporter CydC subunit
MIFASYLLSAYAFIGGIGLTISSGWLITMAAQHPPIMTLTVAIVGVRFFGISRSAARYAERVVSHKAVFDRLTAIRTSLYRKITSSSIKFIQEFTSASAVKTLVDDVERAQEYQLRVVLPRVAAVIALITGALLGLWVNFTSILITGPALLLTLLIYPKLILRNCQRSAAEIEQLENEYTRAIEVSTYGITEAQIYGYLAEIQQHSADLAKEISETEQKLIAKSGRLSYLTSVTIGSTLVALVILAFNLRQNEYIPAVQVAMLIFLPLVLFEAVTAWYPNLFAAGKLTASAASVSALASNTSTEPERVEKISVITELVAEDLQVAWGKEFMKPVSFKVKRGELLVIRGRSGSGKSTLAMGLLGLLPVRGNLIANGTELDNQGELTGHIVGTVQRSHIFNTTVRENLLIANPDCSDDELFKVLAMVELTDLIGELPNGLDTQIGEFGRAFSGGEAKRLSVARALLSGAEVVILDEPTEHLDLELAHRIESSIRAHLGDRVLIVITHSGWHEHDATIEMKALSSANL